MAESNSIIRCEQDGVEFFTVQATGESGMSLSGLARLCGVTPDATSKLLKSVPTSSCPKFLKDLQSEDFGDLTLSTGSSYKNITIVKDKVCAYILEWYAFESQRTNDTARYSYRQFAKTGVRIWIQGITGWQQSQPLSLPGEPYWYKRVKKFLADNKVPPGYFSIFQETLGLVAELEAAGYVLPDDAIPDMSIGKCWANYLRSQNVNPKSISVKYPHHYPGWAHPVPAYAYDEEYLPKFRKWFRENYRKSKLPNYLKGKDRTSLPALAKVLEIPLHILTGQAS